MVYRVTSAETEPIRLGNRGGAVDILRNIALLLATPKGSVPLCRDYGIDWSILDLPVSHAGARIVSEVREAIEEWVAGAEFLSARCEPDPNEPGRLIAVVNVEITEEGEIDV